MFWRKAQRDSAVDIGMGIGADIGAALGFAARQKAQACLRDRPRLKKLLDQALAKAQRRKTGSLAQVWLSFTAILRLLRAYGRRDYTAAPWKSLVLAMVAILYFVAPTDLLPDVIPGIGWLDDAAVIGWAAAAIKQDLDAFAAWEKTHPQADESPRDSPAGHQ